MPARRIVHVRPREGGWEVATQNYKGEVLFHDRASALDAAKAWAAENAPSRVVFHTATGEGEVFDFESEAGESAASQA